MYRAEREVEVASLVDPEVAAAVAAHAIELTTFAACASVLARARSQA